MRKRILGITAIAVASVVVLAGCGSGGGKTTSDGTDFGAKATGTLKAWGFENADDVGKARLDYAAKQLGDVKIDLDATAFDAQKFTTRIASGDVPDVVQMDRRSVTTYAAQGLIQPLEACFKEQDVSPGERWYPSVVDDVTYENDIWGAPQFYQPPAILVNKKVLAEAGVTADQFDTSKPDQLLEAISKVYKASGGTPSRLGFDPVASTQGGLWILGAGGQLADEKGLPTLDDPRNIAGIELLKKIVDAQGGYAAIKSFSDSFDAFGENNQYVAGQVGAQINLQWYANVLAPYAKDIELEAVPFRGADGKPFAVTSGTAFVIPVGAKNPAAACAWVTKITSDAAWAAAGDARGATRKADGGINTGLFTGSPSADKAVRDKWVKPTGNADFDQVISTFYDVASTGKAFGSSPAGQEIQNELNNAVTAALLGDKTPKQALADAQKAAKRAYDNAIAD